MAIVDDSPAAEAPNYDIEDVKAVATLEEVLANKLPQPRLKEAEEMFIRLEQRCVHNQAQCGALKA